MKTKSKKPSKKTSKKPSKKTSKKTSKKPNLLRAFFNGAELEEAIAYMRAQERLSFYLYDLVDKIMEFEFDGDKSKSMNDIAIDILCLMIENLDHTEPNFLALFFERFKSRLGLELEGE